MVGKVIAGMISVALITFLIISITFYFLQENIKVEINRINYQTVEIITTKGFFSKDLYEDFKDNISRYSDFHIQLKLERLIKNGVYDTYYNLEDIIDQPLKIGDKISIYLEDRHLTIFARLLTTAIGSGGNGAINNQQIKSLKTGIVAKNRKNLVKGYDVIADIKYYESFNDIALHVITKMNSLGKFYGWQGHPDVVYNNLYYGDSEDERGNTGINYIFDNGNFIREIEYYPNGEIRLIRYIQH